MIQQEIDAQYAESIPLQEQNLQLTNAPSEKRIKACQAFEVMMENTAWWTNYGRVKELLKEVSESMPDATKWGNFCDALEKCYQRIKDSVKS